jgi:hypothetical protein
MICLRCGRPIPAPGRRDRRYCSTNCAKRASEARRKKGIAPPGRRQHPALGSDNPTLCAAAARVEQLVEARGWSPTMRLRVLDGLMAVLADHPLGEPVPLTEVRTRTARLGCGARAAEVLADLGLLTDDSTPAIRSWIERQNSGLPAGFAADVRAWLLVLLDGDARSRPRSPATIRAYFGSIQPLLHAWEAANRGHLREITVTDVTTVLDPLRGWPRSNAITALRSLFRFATRRRIVFHNPTARLGNPDGRRSMLPMSEAEIRATEACIRTPAQRLIVSLAAVHAAHASTIRHLLVDDVDLPNRRIVLDGVTQPLGSLTHRLLCEWMHHRRDTWPHTRNRHLILSRSSAHGVDPVGRTYLTDQLLPPGITIERIRTDRILHEAVTSGGDPLHLALVFNLAHTTAGHYAGFAKALLDDQCDIPKIGQDPAPQPAELHSPSSPSTTTSGR